MYYTADRCWQSSCSWLESVWNRTELPSNLQHYCQVTTALPINSNVRKTEYRLHHMQSTMNNSATALEINKCLWYKHKSTSVNKPFFSKHNRNLDHVMIATDSWWHKVQCMGALQRSDQSRDTSLLQLSVHLHATVPGFSCADTVQTLSTAPLLFHTFVCWGFFFFPKCQAITMHTAFFSFNIRSSPYTANLGQVIAIACFLD